MLQEGSCGEGPAEGALLLLAGSGNQRRGKVLDGSSVTRASMNWSTHLPHSLTPQEDNGKMLKDANGYILQTQSLAPWHIVSKNDQHVKWLRKGVLREKRQHVSQGD